VDATHEFGNPLKMFPTTAGDELARAWLLTGIPLQVDLTTHSPAMLIGGFFNAFLQHVHDHAPTMLERARRIEWVVKFEFQRKNIATWVREFNPTR
jgi:hypothetical protein